ncbi:dienelactone hydrolase, partial [Micrococcus endophyticus]
MAQILLFHHALGLTDGVRALAAQIEAGGHTVHTPDLYDGALFTDVEEGIAHVESLGGFDVIAEAGMRAA